MRWFILVLVGFAVHVTHVVNIACAQAPVASGAVITIAGNGSRDFAGDGGQAINASVSGPLGIAVGPDGTLYIADANNYRVRAVDPTSGIISTFAGIGPPPGGFFVDGPNGDGGPATSAQIGDLLSLAIDRERGTLYFPSTSLNRVRQVNLVSGIIDNFAGIGMFDNDPNPQDGDRGPATSAFLPFPLGVAVGRENDVFITDDYRLRRVDTATGIIDRVAGIEDQNGFPVYETGGDGGPASQASFSTPYRQRVDRDGNVFVIDAGDTWTVRRIDAITGIITRIAGGGANPPEGGGAATGVEFTNLQDIALDNNGNLFIAHGNQIFTLALATGQLSTYAGTGVIGFSGDGGPAGDAQFSDISGLATVPGGGLLVADTTNDRIRYIAPDSINLVGDAGQTEFHLPWTSVLTGSVTISDNPNATSISLSGLSSVTGTVEISDNAATGVIDLSALETTGGSVAITSNEATGVIDLGALETTGGSVAITSNEATGVINLSSLESVTGDVTIIDNGNASVNVGSLATVTGNVTLETASTGTVTLSNFRASGWTVSGGTVEVQPENGTTVVQSLSIVGTPDDPEATLDLTNNGLIVNYPVAGPNPAATIREQIIAGRGGSGLGKTWNGQGITSSQAAADPVNSMSVGYADNATMPLGALDNFRGETVDPTSVLMAYTRTSDANLDGVVNNDDVTIVGANYAPGFAKPRWDLGDFDYNGFVDNDDVTLLGVFYNPSAAPIASPAADSASENVAAVPEPSSYLLLAAAAFILALAWKI